MSESDRSGGAPGFPLLPGDPSSLGRWSVLRRLGSGGMGVVYLATDGHLTGALKVVAPHLGNDQTFRVRFQRETALCGRITGPNVARLLDSDTDASPPWLVLQYVAGPTLQSWVDQHGPVVAGLSDLAGGIAAALEQIHAAGIIHRDLKPSNVILTTGGPVVIDFGIATAAEATSLTATGLAIGSAGWMAPEQIQGKPVTEAADVFGWAANIAFTATGRPPFGSGRPEAIAYRVVHDSPDLTGVPHNLLPLLTASLQPEPALRPTVPQLVAALSGNPMASPTIVDPSPSIPTAVDTTTVLPPPAATNPTDPARTPSRSPRRWVMAVVSLAIVASAGVGAFFVGRSQSNTGSGAASTTAVSASDAADDQSPSQTSAPAASTTVTTAIGAAPVEAGPGATDDASVNIVVPGGASSPAMPTTLAGWAPVGPVQRTTVRVFAGEAFARAEPIGPSTNTCGSGLWTARWRSLDPDVGIQAALQFRALTEVPGDPAAMPGDAPVGGAGYMSGFVCETPVFRWSVPNPDGGNLVDVVIEWQEWEPAP